MKYLKKIIYGNPKKRDSWRYGLGCGFKIKVDVKK